MENAIKPFSAFHVEMQDYENQLAEARLMQPVKPWNEADATEEKRVKRVKKAKEDFWYFDKTYFPPNVYSDGYSKPAAFHRELIDMYKQPGIHVVLGARKHAKTAETKKLFTWLVLTGRVDFGATLSATLPTSRNILADIAFFLDNERIKFDFKPEFIESNSDQITFRIPGEPNARRIVVVSEGRSLRGATFGFSRPKFVLCDDLETLQSPLSADHTRERLNNLKEAFQSMTDNAVLIALGNNFDENFAFNRVKFEYETGILPEHWNVHIYPAWNGSEPLWPERYPAKSEAELRTMLKVTDESEWQGEFMQIPCPPDGIIFSREHLQLYDSKDLPKDVKGVLYTDPNLAKKGKGDTTAISGLVYSPSTDRYYLHDMVCRSFGDPFMLLDRLGQLFKPMYKAIGFDGNVNQESHWTAHVRNYSRVNRKPFPYIKYCRYRVDDVAKNMQALWNSGKILVNSEAANTEDGKRFLTQLFAFAGKKAGKLDDAPDSVICAGELMFERAFTRPTSSRTQLVSVISDNYF